jgi:hypothetical protein
MSFTQSKLIGWRTSSFCANSECAQVSQQEDEVLLRSTRAPLEVTRLTLAEWHALVKGIQAGDFADMG